MVAHMVQNSCFCIQGHFYIQRHFNIQRHFYIQRPFDIQRLFCIQRFFLFRDSFIIREVFLFRNIFILRDIFIGFGLNLLRISFDEVREFVKVYDGIRYLLLFVSEKYDAFSNRIRYLLSQKSCITYVSFHNKSKIKIGSYDSLSLEKMLTLRIAIFLLKSVLHKDKNQYCL